MKFRLPNKRVRVPTVIQLEAVECGAAALAMVLAHYRCIVPLEQLREECGVSRDGSKALNILKAARRRGMKADGFKYDIPELCKIRLPAILFWNFNHFVVLEGFGRGGKEFFINDPVGGRRKVPFEEFNESYTGVVLAFEPGPDFRRGGRNPSALRFLLERLPGNTGAFLYAFVCALLLVVPGLAIPAFSRVFIDDILVGTEKGWIRPLLSAMAVALVLQCALVWLQQKNLLRFHQKLSLSGAGRFMQHVLRLPVKYFSQRFGGEIGSRLALCDEVAGLVGGDMAKICLDFVLVAIFGVMLFFYDSVLATISIAIAVLNAGVVQLVARVRADRSRVVTQAGGKLVGTSINGLHSIETIKSCGREDEFFARWAGFQAKFLEQRQAIGVFSETLGLIPASLNLIGSGIILGTGAFRIMDGQLTLGTFVAFQALSAQFLAPFGSLIHFWNLMPSLTAKISRIQDVLQAPADPIYSAEPNRERFADVDRLTGKLEFRDVSFGYSPLDPPLIRALNLTLEPGRRLALVGGSGSGKSTIARLAAGLYRPWEGSILYDGCAIGEISRPLFASSVAMVDQEIVFFSGSARDNLTFWDASVSDTAIHQACKDAEVSRVLLSRSGGYSSEIAEGGSNLSGGERQRLEIARSLVRNPSLLILDEATSALDATTEAAIDRNLRERKCACLIVAHRLSTVRDADEIIVMDSGKVVERGTFDSLYDQQGELFRLMQQ